VQIQRDRLHSLGYDGQRVTYFSARTEAGRAPRWAFLRSTHGKTSAKHTRSILNNARKEKTFLTIYLMSGVKLLGKIKSFDKYRWCSKPTIRNS
jgi:hypothetical protein